MIPVKKIDLSTVLIIDFTIGIIITVIMLVHRLMTSGHLFEPAKQAIIDLGQKLA